MADEVVDKAEKRIVASARSQHMQNPREPMEVDDKPVTIDELSSEEVAFAEPQSSLHNFSWPRFASGRLAYSFWEYVPLTPATPQQRSSSLPYHSLPPATPLRDILQTRGTRTPPHTPLTYILPGFTSQERAMRRHPATRVPVT